MTVPTGEISPRDRARVAGFLYLLLVPLAYFGFPYGPSRLFVSGDAAATANNILSAESLFRASIAINLLGAMVNVLVALALYPLLKPVNKLMASLMVIFYLLSAPIAMLNELNHAAILLLLSGANYLAPFTTNQLQALVLLFHDLHKYGLAIAEVFWGLWLFPMGYCILKSGFLPKILGILLIVACLGYLVESVAAFLLPTFALKIPMPLITGWGEILLPLWLLIKGVDLKQWNRRTAESA